MSNVNKPYSKYVFLYTTYIGKITILKMKYMLSSMLNFITLDSVDMFFLHKICKRNKQYKCIDSTYKHSQV